MNRLEFRYIAIAAALAAAGCNIETTPESDEPPVSAADVDLGEGFHAEPYGIGADWYAYESETHAVTPRPFVYRLAGGEAEVAFAVESYYDARGDSGYFTLRVQRAGEPAETLALDASVKDAPVCVDLAAPAAVDCAQGRHDLVLRTDLRVVPAAGFAVQNPSIYTRSHHASGASVAVMRASGDRFDAPTDDWEVLPDAKSRRADALLAETVAGLDEGDSSPVFVQATADMHLVAWSLAGTDELGTLDFSATCEELQAGSQDQVAPDPTAAATATIAVEPDSLAYVDLCAEDGPAVVEQADEPARGLWPASDTYDLVVERFDAQVSIRLAPGHLIWSTETHEPVGALEIPASLWE